MRRKWVVENFRIGMQGLLIASGKLCGCAMSMRVERFRIWRLVCAGTRIKASKLGVAVVEVKNSAIRSVLG
jgi:hypothetical protein